MQLYTLRIVIGFINKTLTISYLLFPGTYNNCLFNTIDINTWFNNIIPHGIKSHKYIFCFLNTRRYRILVG